MTRCKAPKNCNTKHNNTLILEKLLLGKKTRVLYTHTRARARTLKI